MSELHRQNHLTDQSRGHMKIQICCISTVTRQDNGLPIEVCEEEYWIMQISAYLYPSLTKKYISNVKEAIDAKTKDATESLCLPKMNTKKPTRTNSVEMKKIVTN